MAINQNNECKNVETSITVKAENSLLNELPVCLDAFIQRLGVTDTTAWRWRKKGWLTTRNIAGRVYVLPKDLREFNRRLESGEFAKEHKAPKRERAFAE